MDREQEIRERLQKVTPWPWRAKRTTDGRCDGIAPAQHNHEGDDCYDFERPGYTTCPATVEIVTTDSGYYGPAWDDAEFIANAPEDMAYLLTELDSLRATLKSIEQRVTCA